MSKKAILVILIVSVAINLATVITFMYFWTHEHKREQPISPRFPDRFHQEHRERLAKELNLQQQQLEELKKVQEEIHLSVREVREELQKKRHALMALVHDQDIDQAKVKQLIAEIAALQAEHDARIFSGVMKLKEILTKEQQRKLGMLLHGMIEPDAPIQPPPEPGHGRPLHPPVIPGGE